MTVGSAQAEIVVERLTPRREPAWTAFVAHHPEGHVYATLPFRDFLLATVGGEAEYLLARRGDEIVGVLPACARRSAPFGVVYNSLPWFGSYGGCLVSPEIGSSARSALLTRWAELVAAEEVLSATLILPPAEAAEMATYVDRLGGAVIEPRRLQLTRLPETADPWPALLADFSAKSRNLARKAMRIGFEEVLTDEDWAWEFLFHTHRDNLTAMGGRHKPRAHLQALRAHLPTSMRTLSIARLRGEPVAAMLLLFHRQTVEYVLPAVRVEHRPLQPLTFLITQAMVRAANAGFRAWNWGGTWATQRTLHRFKAGLGGRDQSYCYVITATPDRRAQLRAEREQALAAFPFWYLYPLELLAGGSS